MIDLAPAQTAQTESPQAVPNLRRCGYPAFDADVADMSTISAIGSGSWQAVGAGIRAEFQSQLLRGALGTAGLVSDTRDAGGDAPAPGGLLDPDLSTGLDALALAGRSVTGAGLTAMRHELLGSLIDALG